MRWLVCAVSALGLAILAAGPGCDGGEPSPAPRSFCAGWQSWDRASREAFLEDEIQAWARENAESGGARFLACMAERVHEGSPEITAACRRFGDVEAYAVIGRLLVREGQICMGIDMH